MKYGTNQRDAALERGHWLEEREAAMRAIDEQVAKLDDAWTKLAIIKDMLTDALTSDGAEQKQWYLCQIALLAGLTIDLSKVDRGIAPSQGKGA